MKYFKGEYLFDGREFKKDAVLVTEDDGTTVSILNTNDCADENIQSYNGIICPGFINTHCHLELSHMRGMLKEKTGLIEFIKGVLSKREASAEVISQAIEDCDREMYENGIVAVGDISNTTDTFPQKAKSLIHYHTFIEVFDLDPEKAGTMIQQGKQNAGELNKLRLSHSIVPHAPYTVSPELFALINEFNDERKSLSSMHNQETPQENEFFISGTGAFADFYRDWGMDISFFQPTGEKSLPSVIPHMSSKGKTLLVHNTFSQIDDIEMATDHFDEVFLCTNPNANLYIEDRLPKYENFLETDAIVTLGTDSIASNWQLSILEEIKTIDKYFPEIGLQTLLTWATSNGARALEIDDWAGSFEPGKKPGVLLIGNVDDLKTNKSTFVKRLL
ncbi:MAG: amidohydrolase family protein [Bacteroidetes bacterium]|nr:amidohydrolase family protein [Bacteroidota bacterium]